MRSAWGPPGTGVCQEYLAHGRSEGGLNDVRQLDTLLKALSVQPQPVPLLASPPAVLLLWVALPCPGLLQACR